MKLYRYPCLPEMTTFTLPFEILITEMIIANQYRNKSAYSMNYFDAQYLFQGYKCWISSEIPDRSK